MQNLKILYLKNFHFRESSTIDETENLSNQIEAEVLEFERLEAELKRILPKRSSCIAHDLALILREVLDKYLPSSKILAKARKFVRKFKKSHFATRLLFEQTSKKVLLPSTTRWGSTYLMLDRILQIYQEMNDIANKVKPKPWPTLTNQQIETLRMIHTLIKPFYGILVACQGESYVTLSKVYFQIIDLKHKLSEMQVKSSKSRCKCTFKKFSSISKLAIECEIN